MWIIGTGNSHKFSEIVNILSPVKIEFKSVKNWNFDEPIENGSTILENAQLKSNYYFEKTNHICLADDTGLFVELLNGEPGVNAARFAGTNATYEQNRQLLLKKLNPFPHPWNAYFETVISIRWKSGEWNGSGRMYGKIIPIGRGTNGFGYDPIFIPEGETRTFSEMSDQEKNQCSHRANALKILIKAVEQGLIPKV